jgi:hypothetical protein
LAIDKKTSPERPVDHTPRRSETTDKRSSVARKRVVIGGVLLLAVVGVLAFLLTRDGNGFGIFSSGGTLPVHFDVTKVSVETTTTTKTKAVKDAANGAADQVKTQLEALYFNAYVDPDTWGDPGELEDLFTEDALARVKDDVATLTIGEHANDEYDFVTPTKGKLKVRVLTDADDQPTQAIATVAFIGRAEHDDSTFTRISSEGSYFFKRIDGDWKIFAFRVAKNEKVTEAPEPSASGSSSASPTKETAQ